MSRKLNRGPHTPPIFAQLIQSLHSMNLEMQPLSVTNYSKLNVPNSSFFAFDIKPLKAKSVFYTRAWCVPRRKHPPPRLHKTNPLMLYKENVHTDRTIQRNVSIM